MPKVSLNPTVFYECSVKTLTSLKSPSVRGLKMKLTKKNAVPCLTFEVDLPSIVESRLCVHDIPVQVANRIVFSKKKTA